MTDAYLGRTLSNRYQLVELVGKGAMGRVYLAKDILLGGVPVAVKFLANTLLNQKMRERFEREATTCALLGQRGVHIVRVMDYGVDDQDVPFYVMEYLQGENLSDLISSRPLPLSKFLPLARQICLGLQSAHQGVSIQGKVYPIIHRDIKPSNILVCQDPTLGDLVKILDFGIAKLLREDAEQTSAFMGTLAYSFPEQMEGKELDSRADIYSLGVLLFEMLTCELPLQPETHTFSSWYKAHHFQAPRSFASVAPSISLPQVLMDLVMSCLAKSPNNRPQSVSDIIRSLDALEDIRAGSPTAGKTAPPTPATDPTTNPRQVTTPPTDVLTAPAEFLSIERTCRAATWPSDKPKAVIAFPQILSAAQEEFVTLWVMLSKQEIINRSPCTRYNQFLYLQNPHPMLLWITALYNQGYGCRWVPCYVDLKTTKGQDIIRLLGTQGQYRLLLFPLEDGQHCSQVMVSTISSFQQPMLREWANSSRLVPAVDQASLSRELLKAEFEKLKPKILLKLETSVTNNSSRFGQDLAN